MKVGELIRIMKSIEQLNTIYGHMVGDCDTTDIRAEIAALENIEITTEETSDIAKNKSTCAAVYAGG